MFQFSKHLLFAVGFVISSFHMAHMAQAAAPTFPEATTISVGSIGGVGVECRIERRADDTMSIRIDQMQRDHCRLAAFDWKRTSQARSNAVALDLMVAPVSKNASGRCSTDYDVNSYSQCGVALGQTFAEIRSGASCRVRGDNMANGCALLDSCRAVLQKTLGLLDADTQLTSSLSQGIGTTSPLQFVVLFNRKAEELGCESR